MKVLDLFSGIGGFSLGLERAGMETVTFCEFDKHAQKVLRKHWPDVPIHDDVRTLDGRQYRGSVDVVCGGFPCQDLSSAGKKAGFDGERSSLYREMLRVISECMPKYAIFENVSGLLTGDGGRWFAKFLYDLAEIGLDAEWHCISASEFNAPHHRDRVWVVAYPKGELWDVNGDGQGRKMPDPKLRPKQPRRQNMPFNDSQWNIKRRPVLESAICGKDDGFSGRVDRLKRLGNSVYPEIPEAIGKAIMEYETSSMHKSVVNQLENMGGGK